MKYLNKNSIFYNYPVSHPKFKRNFFKQLFCNHKYENFQHENKWGSFVMCEKCGFKRKF